MGNPDQDVVAGPATAPLGQGDDEYYDLPESGGIGRGPASSNVAEPGQSSRAHIQTEGVETGQRPSAPPFEPRRHNGQYDAFILRNLHTFKGDYNGTAITEWIQKADLLFKISGATNEDTGITDDCVLSLLPLRVETSVITFLEGLRDRLGSQYKWPKVKKALLEQYGGATDPTKHVTHLHSARMGRDTPVRKFAQEIDRLARLAYPELVSDQGTREQRSTQQGILNRITLEQFISGLPPLLSRPLVERQIEDFNEAVRVAAHLEEVNARYFRKSTINAYFDTDESEPRREPNFLPPAPSNQAHYRPRHPPRASYGQGPREQHYYQDRAPRQFNPGHMRGNGSQQSRQGRPGSNPGNPFRGPRPTGPRPSGPRQPPYCTTCRRTGHYWNECPQSQCFICGAAHKVADCTSVLCANCKMPGHPATRCSKNSTGPHPRTTTS